MTGADSLGNVLGLGGGFTLLVSSTLTGVRMLLSDPSSWPPTTNSQVGVLARLSTW